MSVRFEPGRSFAASSLERGLSVIEVDEADMVGYTESRIRSVRREVSNSDFFFIFFAFEWFQGLHSTRFHHLNSLAGEFAEHLH